MIQHMIDQDTTTVLSDSNLALVEELRTVRDTIKGLKGRESDIRKTLLEELKDSDQGITASGVPIVAIDRQVRTRVDNNRLQALYQDVWKDCQVESIVQVLRLPEDS